MRRDMPDGWLWSCASTRWRQLVRITMAVGLVAGWVFLVVVTELDALQRDEVLSEQLQSLRERVARNETVIFPTAATVMEIRIQVAAINETISAGKYLAGLLTASSVGHLMLAVYGETPKVRRRRRQEENEDSGPIEVER